ncbi:MAG TPA: DUF98 domain-containing protein [Methanothermococcus okinawensis]|uniref:DUF98 domain-containing protein n=1 Tax=Methanothermococcus okinawensis TaxID=155863 RepID=A0A832ZAA0_9EURY|nr:DUF98 domain-containing protein [Methanococcaceae archaeon]HIP84134.1 DUF98 domain-containing protein [Methanothermococcus okinawensis]HIP91680.1 DUF98 domain-containing protein [Methanothermococcus okinawensis]
MVVKPYRIINKLARRYPLRNEEKMLLGTDGSITNLLEILFNDEVVVETISQRIVECVNYRSVILKIRDIPLVYATSKIPLKNIQDKTLRDSIRRDLLSADIPIGKILKMHNLETRREIVDITCREVEESVRRYLNTERRILPQRTYNIIYRGKTLMEIREIFNVGEHL